MYKPFEILSTQPDPLGTAVIYRASVRESTGDSSSLKTVEGHLLVPHGADIDKTLFDFLKDCGWIR